MIQKSYDGTNSLYLIPTPIGNMDDITNRAVDTLNMVDYILCEDTRVSGELLSKLGIKKKLIHSDDHTEDNIKERVLKLLQEGNNIGLVTDRGTPIISDPGYKIVEYISNNGFNVISLPGATAFVPALTMSAIAPSPFVFYGFLNNKSSKRIKELESLKHLPYTIIFYEAPHRINSTLNDLLSVFGDRKIALCREISKKFEECIRGNITDVLKCIDGIKGEIVLVVSGNLDDNDFSDLSLKEHVELYLDDGLSEKEAIKRVAFERKIQKSIVYKEYHLNK